MKVKIIKVEDYGAAPYYRPGDIVTCKDGGVGVIVGAQVTVNGRAFEWNEPIEIPEAADRSAFRPVYSLDQLPGEKELDYLAWWEASDWRIVELGPLHKRKRRDV